MSVADYGVGIVALRGRDSPFPPNPGEFFALCRPELPEQRRVRESALRLPPPYLPPAEAMKQIQKIREEHGV